MAGELTSTKRLARNTLMMYVRMGITMFVGLITVRALLQTLGIEDFGLYNAVSGFVVLISFLNNSLTLVTQRYLSYAIGEGNKQKLQDVFNASLYIYLAVAGIVIFIGETIFLWFLNTKMTFPQGKLGLANFVYQFSIIITCLNILRTPFNSLFIAMEKLDFYALQSIVESLINLVFVLLLLVVPFNPAYVYILFQTLSVLIILLWSYKYFRKYFSAYIKIATLHNRTLFRELLSFSGWGIFGTVAVIGFQQGINIMLNLFFGVTVNAAFGIANRVSSLVNQLFTGFQTAASPQITKAHASRDVRAQVNLINRTSKITFFLLMVVGVVVIYNLDFMLKVWLKDVPEYTVSLSRLMIIGAIVDALSAPLYVTIYATGKIKYYQIVISIVLLCNIVGSYLFFNLGYSVETCMYIRIALFVVAYFVRLYFVRLYTRIDVCGIIKEVLFPIISISIIVASIVCISWSVQNQLVRLFAITPIHVLWMFAIVYVIGFNKLERVAIKKTLSKILNSKLKK